MLIRVTVQSGQQVNVEEYRYDYAGNRIAKIGELNETYYLVDTNGALSQVLAEYGENGTLKTYYTCGAEMISQERNGAKSYYLYDGQDSVRMLTDEDGSVTDTYTFDAFGNLTDSTGDTENSYLYRGEQFDTFTGLYYLRARYMNPSTGTFITMDEYAGSLFEPVSLHKYLYANANPVMYSDPSGYSPLSELMTACAISSILGGIINESICLLRFFFDKSFNLNAYGGNLTLALLDSFVQGAYSGFIFGGFGYIAAHSILVSTVMIAFCGYSAWESYSSAWQKSMQGNTGGAWIDSTLGAMSVIGAFSFAYSAYNQFQAWAASRNPCNNGNTCFVGSTAVAAEDGQKRIDEIVIGDKVWAYNVETGETELKTVTKVYVHSVDEILHLYTDEGSIDTTANHPFYVIGKGWVAAGDLAIGDKVYNLDGTTSTILGFEVEMLDEPVLVYNLEVEDFNSYFVSDICVLVHNYTTENGAGIKNVYPSIKDSPNYPKGFVGAKNGTTKNNVNNSELLNNLRKLESGKWYKVYKDGYNTSGDKVSIHFFQSQSGKVFDVKVKSGWSNPSSH